MMTTDNNTFGVTLELHVRYRKPVPLECELRVVSRITSDRGRIFEGTGELYLPDGTVAVEAEGKYMKRNLAQITDKDFTSNEWFEPKESIPDEIVV
jgi:acyl-CoA thioesterase FadM